MILSLGVDLVSEQMYSSVKFWLNGPLAAFVLDGGWKSACRLFSAALWRFLLSFSECQRIKKMAVSCNKTHCTLKQIASCDCWWFLIVASLSVGAVMLIVAEGAFRWLISVDEWKWKCFSAFCLQRGKSNGGGRRGASGGGRIFAFLQLTRYVLFLWSEKWKWLLRS